MACKHSPASACTISDTSGKTHGAARLAALFTVHAAYPWSTHFLLLMPLTVVVLLSGAAHGFWGEGPRLWYEGLRQTHHLETLFFKAISDYAAIALYGLYAAIFARSLRDNDTDGTTFVVRFACAAILFSLLLTQCLKMGLGMPRPGEPLPPMPFSFKHAYSSFPSGHTVAIIAAALPLAIRVKKVRWQIVLVVLITALGYSRLWLGAHHPVDILGGVVVGSIAARYVYLPPRPVSPENLERAVT
ncbi:conserved membrane hypothetical protein [uncultured delta proteobacterium]|uniref:Phosphatidic acid phosphatase type 2/haloperoxidase domain-containing protein n=1 Tax=uncultured delta proteobacterium TaxID=34034 RepID=A0A212JEQ4_9DELT|nr:conserved membrane hypothetical protein [uncultured delta proteobacterium]